MQIFVSADGNDAWSGRLKRPSADRSDGPLATIGGARDRLRTLRRAGQVPWPATIVIAGGRYAQTGPLTFTHEDAFPTTYRAAEGEQVLIDGGRRITGWRHGTVNGRACWVADLPDVRTGRWSFRSLFVGGERRLRPQLPKPTPDPTDRPFFRMEDVPGFTFAAGLFDGTNAFVAKAGDVDPSWRNLTDVEVVVLHYWVECRLPIASIDPATRLVTSDWKSRFSLKDDFNERWAKYYVDNVFEALTEPGEWYLDRPSGTLYYIPMPGESMEATEVYAPVAEQLLVLEGEPEAGRHVEFLRFEGLTFRHCDWTLPRSLDERIRHHQPSVRHMQGGGPQGATHLPGVVSLRGARSCELVGCTVECGGYYGIDVRDGSEGNRIADCTIRAMGAGGVKIGGGDALDDRRLRTGGTAVTGNHLYDLGQVFHSGVGIAVQHADRNRIARNHVHDLFYSPVSVGWVWGYAESLGRDNVIELNHLHDYGKGWLADMGGVYLLGVSPGTVVRGNLIHDAKSATYGGWGVYLDEGASHIVVENNVCFRFSSQPFNAHFGRENTVRGNVLGFGADSQISLGRGEGHVAFTFTGNVVVTDGKPVYVTGYRGSVRDRNFLADGNRFLDVAAADGAPNALAQDPAWRKDSSEPLGWEAWRSLGQDANSTIMGKGVARPAANWSAGEFARWAADLIPSLAPVVGIAREGTRA